MSEKTTLFQKILDHGYLTPSMAARVAGVTDSHITAALQRKSLPTVLVFGRKCVSIEALRTWVGAAPFHLDRALPAADGPEHPEDL